MCVYHLTQCGTANIRQQSARLSPRPFILSCVAVWFQLGVCIVNLILFGNVITTPPLWTEKAVTRHRLLSQPSQNSPLTTSAERRIKWTDAGLVVVFPFGPQHNPTTTKKCRDDGRDWRIKPLPFDADFRYSLSFCSPPKTHPAVIVWDCRPFFDVRYQKEEEEKEEEIIGHLNRNL